VLIGLVHKFKLDDLGDRDLGNLDIS